MCCSMIRCKTSLFLLSSSGFLARFVLCLFYFFFIAVISFLSPGAALWVRSISAEKVFSKGNVSAPVTHYFPECCLFENVEIVRPKSTIRLPGPNGPCRNEYVGILLLCCVCRVGFFVDVAVFSVPGTEGRVS